MKKVIAAIFINEGRVLIAQRAKKDALYGKWEFPGGKLEGDETDQECLKRELYEEFSIHAEVGAYLCSSYFEHNNMPYEMRAYYVTSYTGEFVLHEHHEIKWVTPDELPAYEMPEPDQPIVKTLIELYHR
ncbi:NUDIX hydrolase [Candidatus Dependentiae bacterium Noda2021]|nr:NUDIX hydrolase [Candidatus Dependentiae bacterium Noda2021]